MFLAAETNPPQPSRSPLAGRLSRRLAALCAAAMTLALCSFSAAGNETKRPPNIIFILADDLGYGDLGCYGQQKIATPNIDRLAAEGMRFTDFYAGCTVCAPSRCVLMTGLHTGHCYIRGNGDANLRPQDLTVAETLKAAGYSTCLIGKWGLGHEGSLGVPTRQGFDYFFGYLSQAHAHNYFPTFLMRNEQRVKLRNKAPNEGKAGQGKATQRLDYSPDLMSREAIAWIEERQHEPFFLYLASTLPHANNEAGKEGMEIPDYGAYRDKDWPAPQKGHAAMIARLDQDVGAVLTALKKLEIDDDTIVFFSSDNGPHREGGNNPDFADSNGPLRGIKRDMYEGGVRIPFIARWPGMIAPASVSHHVGYFADFLPTAAELSGSPLPKPTDGLSILPTLLGRAKEQREHDDLYWEFYEQGGKRGLRMGNWKGICRPFDGPMELYDLATDVGEEHNLAEQHPDVVAKIRSAMREAHTPSPLWKVK